MQARRARRSQALPAGEARNDSPIVFRGRRCGGRKPVVDDRRGRLTWVDIIGRRVHALDPETGEHRLWPMPFRPTSLSLCENGDALVCSERHVCRWDWQSAPRPLIEVEPDLPMNRAERRRRRPRRCVVVGFDASEHRCRLTAPPISRAKPAACIAMRRTGCCSRCRMISSASQTRLSGQSPQPWLADTLQNTLFRYPISPRGELARPRAAFGDALSRGLPDGSCVDARGQVWNARVVGRSFVAQLAPDGRLIAYHELPCSWPTSCALAVRR